MALSSNFNGDVHTGGQIEFLNRPRSSRLDREYQSAVVGALFESFLRLFVRVRERWTVNFSMRVGNGMGPATRAPVRLTDRQFHEPIGL